MKKYEHKYENINTNRKYENKYENIKTSIKKTKVPTNMNQFNQIGARRQMEAMESESEAKYDRQTCNAPIGTELQNVNFYQIQPNLPPVFNQMGTNAEHSII